MQVFSLSLSLTFHLCCLPVFLRLHRPALPWDCRAERGLGLRPLRTEQLRLVSLSREEKKNYKRKTFSGKCFWMAHIRYNAASNSAPHIYFIFEWFFQLAHVMLGWFLLRKVWNFKSGMLPSCCILITVFKTVFVFALGPFLPMFVIFFCFNGNYNGKTDKNLFTAIKSSKIVLQPSSYHCWATFL